MNKTKAANQPKVIEMSDPDAKPGQLKRLAGANDDQLNNVLANQLVNSLWLAHEDEAGKDSKIRAALAALVGLQPANEVEGMLAVQMVACHSAALECYRRAMLKEQTHEGRQQNLNFANKLTRTYAQLLETLDKHRGKGQQKVTVEHVHVHQGGQAIVGNVETGGTTNKSEVQPHASIVHAPEQDLRSALSEERQAVPKRRDEER